MVYIETVSGGKDVDRATPLDDVRMPGDTVVTKRVLKTTVVPIGV